jgi:hypothetical protein
MRLASMRERRVKAERPGSGDGTQALEQPSPRTAHVMTVLRKTHAGKQS